MALATQCPHCQTSFRVANDQLKLYAGIVRCGTCKQTFNGIDHLLSVGDQAQVPSIKTATDTALDAPLDSSLNTAPNTAQNASLDATLNASTDTPIDALANTQIESELALIEAELQVETALDTIPDVMETALETETETETETEIEVEFKPEAESTLANIDVSPIQEAQEAQEEQIENLEIKEEAPTVSEDEIENENEIAVEVGKEVNQEANETNNEVIPEAVTTEIEVIVATSVDNSFIDSQTATDPLIANSKFEADLLEQTTEMMVVEEVSLDSSSSLFPKLLLTEEDVSNTENIDPKTEVEADIYSVEESTSTTNQVIDKEDAALHSLEETTTIKQTETDLSLDQSTEIQTQLLDSIPDEETETTSETTKLEHQNEEASTDNIEPEPDTDTDAESEKAEIKPQFVIQAENKKRYGKWITALYSVFILLFIVSAFGVVSYHYRNNLYAHFPQAQPHLLSACKLLDCSINLLAEKGAITKESQELVMLSTNPNIMLLSVQLQNKSRTVQAWPMIELTLLDARKKTLLQRVFNPTEYLVNKKDFGTGMPAQTEKNIDIHFKLGIEKANSYEVKIFYH